MTDKAWTMLILIVLMMGSIVLNVWQANKLRYYADRPSVETFDNIFAKKAAGLWSVKARESIQDVVASRYPKVIYFDQNACVELDFRQPSLGGAPVYCFDQSTTKLLGRYDDVE